MPDLLSLYDTGGDENDLPPVLRMIAPGWRLLTPRLDWDAASLVSWIGQNTTDPPFVFAYGAGADLAAELLLGYPGALAGGLLLRPSDRIPKPAFSQTHRPRVAIIAGAEGECVDLARALNDAGAQVDLAVNGSGRELTPQDFALAKQWLASVRTQKTSFSPNWT